MSKHEHFDEILNRMRQIFALWARCMRIISMRLIIWIIWRAWTKHNKSASVSWYHTRWIPYQCKINFWTYKNSFQSFRCICVDFNCNKGIVLNAMAKQSAATKWTMPMECALGHARVYHKIWIGNFFFLVVSLHFSINFLNQIDWCDDNFVCTILFGFNRNFLVQIKWMCWHFLHFLKQYLTWKY